MGCVTDLTISGDNDAPIFPVRYYRHYLYCDQCGSFELRIWEEPKKGFWGRLFRQTEFLGVRCLQCQATYKYGSRMFTNLDANPREFTMADVPRPLNRTYYLIGKTIGPAEDA